MLEKFTDYFERIEIPKPIVAKAESICFTFREFISKPITHAFVTDDYEVTPEKENVRRYKSLWLVTEGGLLMECKKFVVESKIDFVRLKGVRYLEITANEFADLNGPSNINSRLKVDVNFVTTDFGLAGSSGELGACHNNCGYLAKFVKDFFWPRLL